MSDEAIRARCEWCGSELRAVRVLAAGVFGKCPRCDGEVMALGRTVWPEVLWEKTKDWEREGGRDKSQEVTSNIQHPTSNIQH